MTVTARCSAATRRCWRRPRRRAFRMRCAPRCTRRRSPRAAIGYVSAGTVEFLYDPAGERFWFLEMNTRLQVEHPVTECVTGIDLVAAQIGIAEGRTLLEVLGTDTTPEPSGHAIEVRLYAETPDAAATPQSGRFSRLQVPHDVAFDLLPRHGVRVDAGYADGSEVSTHYDAMLAKVIVWAADRPSALRALGARAAPVPAARAGHQP